MEVQFTPVLKPSYCFLAKCNPFTLEAQHSKLEILKPKSVVALSFEPPAHTKGSPALTHYAQEKSKSVLKNKLKTKKLLV